MLLAIIIIRCVLVEEYVSNAVCKNVSAYTQDVFDSKFKLYRHGIEVIRNTQF